MSLKAPCAFRVPFVEAPLQQGAASWLASEGTQAEAP